MFYQIGNLGAEGFDDLLISVNNNGIGQGCQLVAVFPHDGQPFQFSKQDWISHADFVNKILYGFGMVNGCTDNFKRLTFELFAQAKAAAVFLNSTVGRL